MAASTRGGFLALLAGMASRRHWSPDASPRVAPCACGRGTSSSGVGGGDVQILDNVPVGNGYTRAATIENVQQSAGGYFSVTGADVYIELQWAGQQSQGQNQWTREVRAGPGNGTLYRGTTGVRFRNAVAGNVATVSASLSERAEPVLALTASGSVADIAGTPYTAYAPVLTTQGVGADPSLGAGAAQGWFSQQPTGLVHCYGIAQFVAPGIVQGVGNYQITMPVLPFSPAFTSPIAPPLTLHELPGAGAVNMYQDYGGNGFVFGLPFFDVSGSLANQGTFQAWYTNPFGTLNIAGDARPWTWGDGEALQWDFCYQGVQA